MQPKIWLSKSTYLRSKQCAKSLYLYKHHYRLRDKPSTKTLQLFKEGKNVEQLARELLFGEGINVRPKSPRSWPKAIETTKLLIENGQPLIFEAAFNFNGVMCAVDVVKVEENNTISCFEIKRGSKVKLVYVNDCALQYFVIHQLGYKVNDFSLINFQGNKEQEKCSEHDFLITSVLETVNQKLLSVEEQVHKAKQVINLDEVPNIAMGEHCHQPYDCDFIGFCTQQQKTEQTF